MDVTFAVVPIFFLHEQNLKQSTESLIEEVDTLVRDNDCRIFQLAKLTQLTLRHLIHIKGPQPPEIIPRKVTLIIHMKFSPSDRNDKHTGMEYSIPCEDGVACFKEISSLILSKEHESLAS